MAIEGDTIVVGAFRNEIGANADQGSVYTFSTTGAAARTQTAKLTASDGAADDELGSAVAIDSRRHRRRRADRRHRGQLRPGLRLRLRSHRR